MIHTVKGFGIVNKAEIDIFLELSCFFDDPADVGNLISGSSAFSKTSLNIRNFMVHILLKPGLENFEHYFTSVPRPGAAVGRSYPTTLSPRPGAMGGRSYPIQGAVAAWAQEGLEELSHVEGQEGQR